MGILDKLKPQPRWKHADPAVRLEALRDLDDAGELATLAETDIEARVRRAAVGRISDPAVLGRIAASDADPDTRDRAAERLFGIATGTDTEAATAVDAVSQLTDPRRLSTVAKSGAIEAVRTNALARITEERALGSIARHAAQETTASQALGRLTDLKEVLEVALNSDHRDAALAAFDRVVAGAPGDLALLKSIESRSQQKAVAKRARSFIQGIEEAEAARVAAEEERRKQQLALVEAVERLMSEADYTRSETELGRLSQVWREWQVENAALSSRFDDAVAAARVAVVERRREAEDAAEQARVRAEALATRDALCVRVETLDGEDVCAQLVPIEEEWRSLTPLVGNGPEADRLAERFAKAVTACRKRHELGAMLTATRASLEALVVEAEGLLSIADAAAAGGRWQTLSREARGQSAILAEASRPADDLTDCLAVVQRGFDEREAAAQEAAIKAQQEAAGRLQRLAERTNRAVEAETMTLREGERLMRDVAAGLDEGAHAESSKAIQEALARLRSLQEKLAPRVRELREMDEWRRFANAQQQEQLIAMAEAIVASLRGEDETGKASDLIATARALRELHAKWHEVAEAPRHSAQKLWERFRVATDIIRSRCEGYFTKLREERGANLEKKSAIVEEAERLAESTDWAKAAARFQELQNDWQQLGPAPRDAAKDLSHRFRAACNQFFTRRRDDLASRKKTWSDNYARKETLCERAEVIAESMEWEAASAEMKRLQLEWKSVGPVRRNKSEAIWNRFRAAADRFFERYHNRHQIALASKIAEREHVVIDLEALAQSADAPPADLAQRVQDLRSNWNRGVPVPTAEMRPLAERWQQAFSTVLTRWPDAFQSTDLDPVTVRHRMEKLVTRVEGLATDTEETTAPGRSQTEMLAARLRSALASNAMGGAINDEAKWRNAADTVKDAQAAWLRLPPISGPEIEILESRFRDGCRRVMDHVRRHNNQSKSSRPGTLAAV